MRRAFAWPIRTVLDRRIAGLANQIASEARDTRAVVADYGAEARQRHAELIPLLVEIRDVLVELRNLAVTETGAVGEMSALINERLEELGAEIARLDHRSPPRRDVD